MRQSLWTLLAAGTLSLSACESLRDAFSAQPDVVATAVGRRLTTERMLSLMNAVPRGTVTPEGAEYVANLWIDLHLFADAWVKGELEADSAAVARVMWSQLTQSVLEAWHDTLVARRGKPSLDSAYDAGTARLFQHILVAPTGAAPGDTAAARQKIGGMLARVRRGTSFGELTSQNTDATRSDTGFLPVGPRGQFVKEFEDAAWALEPGQVSDVVQTQFGFHIIRRTPKDEARARFETWLSTGGQQAADSTYLAELAAANDLELEDNLGPAVKDALADPSAARRSSRRLVTFKGGAFTQSDLMRWLEAFPPNAPQQLTAQPDSVITEFVKQLAQNSLVLRQADSAGVTYAVADWQAAELRFRALVDQLAAALPLTDSVVTDSTRPQRERLDSAAVWVERFLDRLVIGQAQFMPFPPSLSALLREREDVSFRLNRAGLNRTMELYTAKRRADSAEAAKQGDTATAPPGGAGPIQPAPGPPPVPQGEQKTP